MRDSVMMWSGSCRSLSGYNWFSSKHNVTDFIVVCGVLRHHFGDTVHSVLPLADFYAVQLRLGESPKDYRIRLNTAAEKTEQCLSVKASLLSI